MIRRRKSKLLRGVRRGSNPFQCIPASNVEVDSNDTQLRCKSDDQHESTSTVGTRSCSLTPSSMNHKSLSTKASKSEMSCGSTNLQDSFVVASTTSLSSMCSSMNQLQSKISGSRDQGIRKARRASKTLPRLNIRSARTKALLDGADSDCSAEARMKSPVSSCTLVTAPCTPLRQDSEDDLHEFPESTGTPEIQVSFDNMVLNPVNNSLSSSSLNSRQAERRMAQAHRRKNAAIAEKEYWKSCIKVAVAQDGSKSVRVAQKLCNLGNALLTCKEYAKSLSAYKKAVPILREKYGGNSLFVACALDKVGYAASMNPTEKNLNWALVALHEALIIRHAHLGPHHCDVVDTLNKIAGIHLHRCDWEAARDAYIEVLTVRAAIFGRNHPSVAVTAQTLGRVYSSLSEFELALTYMEIALKLFREKPMSMKDNNPLIVKLLRNINCNDRLRASLG